jgi:hypothetical protein
MPLNLTKSKVENRNSKILEGGSEPSPYFACVTPYAL